MRQFILEKQKVQNGLVELIGKDFRYLRQVLRVKPGDMLNVRFDDGTLQGTTVASVDDKAKKIILQVCDSNAVENDKSITRGVQATQIDSELPQRNYILFQFIPRPQKMELIVRQATECGVNYIVPVIGEFSEKSSIAALEGAKKERLERIIKEARQQSGSPVCTKVTEPMTLSGAIDFWNNEKASGNDAAASDSENSLAVVLWERTDGEVPLSGLLKERARIDNVCIAVGSEGGISPSEVELLKEKGLFSTIHFAVNILRCETAALYGIAAVQTAISELKD